MDTLPIEKVSPSDLETVAKQFENWRSNRQKRDRIPQHLWQAAAELCMDYPATRVCRCLRLSFADLKKHLPCEAEKLQVKFMPISFPGRADHWQLCCQRSDGARLSFSASTDVPDIDKLIEIFLS